MSTVNRAVGELSQLVGRAATMTTEAAGALGGAAANGVVGGVTGAVAGVQRGISSGSHSTPAAALTAAALGVAGLVEWPVLLTVGGATLVLRQLNRRPDAATTPVQPTPRKAAPARTAKRTTPTKKAAAPRSRSSQSRTGK